MNKDIKFSILLPTFNRGYRLSKTIDSVLQQNYSNWELIVIDDASTDDTMSIIEKYEDHRIKNYKMEENCGVNVARNKAIDMVEGDYILLLDSDNLLMEDILNKYISLLKSKEYDYIKMPCINQDGFSTVKNDKFQGHITYKEFLTDKMKGEYATLVKSDLLKEIKFFNDINGGEGITWKLIAKKTDVVYYEPIIALIYDDSGEDRLSIKSKNYKRLSEVFSKDLSILYFEYIKFAPLFFVKNFLKFIIYKLLSLK